MPQKSKSKTQMPKEIQNSKSRKWTCSTAILNFDFRPFLRRLFFWFLPFPNIRSNRQNRPSLVPEDPSHHDQSGQEHSRISDPHSPGGI
jgi:hypothetical protein